MSCRDWWGEPHVYPTPPLQQRPLASVPTNRPRASEPKLRKWGELFDRGPWRAERRSKVLWTFDDGSDWIVWNGTGQSVASHLKECEAKLLVAAYDRRHELTKGEFGDA